MQFKVGQIVRLKKGRLSREFAVKPGTRAKVIRENYRSPYDGEESISVKWADHNSQVDGGYGCCDFELVAEPDGQMLFDFMYGKV